MPRNHSYVDLSGLRLVLGDGFGHFGLASSVGALFLRLVVGMGLLVVLAALAAEEVENFLSVGTAHTASVPPWRRAEKRTTLVPEY
ncbi:MAG: hypothetical protein ACYDC3_18295 [Candidatus Binataceae bacterium]